MSDIAEDLTTMEDTQQGITADLQGEDARKKGMQNNWDETGSQYHLVPVANQVKVLPTAVYVMKSHPNGVLYLDRLEDKFKFGFKLYGIEREFIDRVVKTYQNTKSNLGVLLNGIKGTGKTITAEIICNELNQPVILVNADFPALTNFINDIQQDITLFFDEFEKVFPMDWRTESKLLTIMDGAMKNEYRKVFLLTTNKLSIEENLLQRPGRIRYLRAFGNLPLATILEIVEDKLKHKARTKDVIHFISRLELITVDIVSAVIEEVNIHDEETKAYTDFFNVKQLSNKVDVYLQEDRKNPNDTTPLREVLIKSNYTLEYPLPYSDDHLGDDMEFNGDHFGEIVEIRGEGNIIVLEREFQPNVKKGERAKKATMIQRTYRLARAYEYHSSFSTYRFIDV